MPEEAPRVDGILETALYVDDLDRARQFYEDILALEPLFSDQRLVAFRAGARSVLLLFRRGGSLTPAQVSGGTIPPHDGSGPVHVAFAVPAADLSRWGDRLERLGIPIIARTDWQRGGRSVYFHDPDGHVVELATPGTWSIY